MKKFFSSVMGALMLGALSLPTMAANYISQPMTVDPASGSVVQMVGQVKIYWPGVSLNMTNRDKDALVSQLDYIDPSYLTILVNDKEVKVDNTSMGGRIYLKVIQESNEQNGGGAAASYDAIIIDFPDTWPDGYFTWKGTVNVKLAEGAVTASNGDTNGPIDITYFYMEANNDIIWTPDPSEVSKFANGECKISATWKDCTKVEYNPDVTIPPYLQKEDPSNDDKFGAQMPVNQYMTVSNNKVDFDFTSLEPGIYNLTIPEASFILGDGIINGETYYSFIILEGAVPPPFVVKALPSQYDWFDGFSVVWGDNPTQPLEISSDYGVRDVNSGKTILNSEGLALIQVKLDGSPIPVLAAAIEEYQENENSQNYPSAQLMITLDGFQTALDGRYSLYIPAGLITITSTEGKVKNSVVEYTFTLKSSTKFVLPAPTVVPAEGSVVNLDNITISWRGTLGGLDLLNFNEEATEPVTISVDGEDFGAFETVLEWQSEDDETPGAGGNLFIIKFNPDQMPEGDAILVSVPAGFIQVSDIEKGTLMNDAFTLVYSATTNGVEGIENESNNLKVYNLQGVKVLESDKASDLKNLSKGLYIVNGKKVILNK